MKNRSNAKEEKIHFDLLPDKDELLVLKAIQAEQEGWLSSYQSADFLVQLGSVKKP